MILIELKTKCNAGIKDLTMELKRMKYNENVNIL